MSFSFSSVVADVKHVLVDLPTLRNTVVAALAALGGVLVLLPHASGPGAAVVSVVAGVGAFLSNPKVVQIISDLAAAAASAFR